MGINLRFEINLNFRLVSPRQRSQYLKKNQKNNYDVLKEKHYNNVTNVKKARIWSEINTKINSLGVAPRTLKLIKDKWKNLTSKAKSTFTEYRKEANKIGGGFHQCTK